MYALYFFVDKIEIKQYLYFLGIYSNIHNIDIDKLIILRQNIIKDYCYDNDNENDGDDSDNDDDSVDKLEIKFRYILVNVSINEYYNDEYANKTLEFSLKSVFEECCCLNTSQLKTFIKTIKFLKSIENKETNKISKKILMLFTQQKIDCEYSNILYFNGAYLNYTEISNKIKDIKKFKYYQYKKHMVEYYKETNDIEILHEILEEFTDDPETYVYSDYDEFNNVLKFKWHIQNINVNKYTEILLFESKDNYNNKLCSDISKETFRDFELFINSIATFEKESQKSILVDEICEHIKTFLCG
jgi:hypothetical protein